MRLLILLLLSSCYFFINAQSRIGVNIEMPEFLFDIRGTDDNLSGGELQLATPSENHFLRFFGGRGFDPKPFLLFSNTDTFRIATSDPEFGDFSELLTVRPDGKIGVSVEQPEQMLDIDGKIKIGNDDAPPTEGTLRYNDLDSSFQGYDGIGWVKLDNKLTYQDKRLGINLGSTVRNKEEAWGDTITIHESGNYLLSVSAYFSSVIDEKYATDAPSASAPYDRRGRLKIYINDLEYKSLECGNGIIDRDGDFYYVSFAPGTRSFMEVINFNSGDEIRLTRNMQASPVTVPNLTIPDLWIASMDAFFIQKLD